MTLPPPEYAARTMRSTLPGSSNVGIGGLGFSFCSSAETRGKYHCGTSGGMVSASSPPGIPPCAICERVGAQSDLLTGFGLSKLVRKS